MIEWVDLVKVFVLEKGIFDDVKFCIKRIKVYDK